MKTLIKLFGILSLVIVMYGCGGSHHYYASRPYGYDDHYYNRPYNYYPGYVRHDFDDNRYDGYYGGYRKHDEFNEHHGEHHEH